MTFEVPKPVIVSGLKLAVIPSGSPTALKLIALSYPSVTTVWIVVVPLVPAAIENVWELLKAGLFRLTTAKSETGAGAEGAYSQKLLS